MARSKATAQNHVPQDRGEAIALLEEIGKIETRLTAMEAEQTERINAIKAETELKATPLKARLKAMQSGVQTYCEANRMRLTEDGKRKHHDFGTGIVRWRNKTRRVTIKAAEEVLARLLKNPVHKASFVRTKHEINKDALREKPGIANQIEGITVGAEGEDFVIEPNFEELGDVA